MNKNAVAENRVNIFEKIKKSDNCQCYLLLAMPLIGFVVFTLYPIMWAALKAFYYYTGVSSQTRFVGIGNFFVAFADKTYWNAWLLTFKFALYKIPVEIFATLILAIMLSSKIKASGFFRTVYYMPCLISVAIVGIIFTNMFSYYGFFNSFAMKCGFINKEIDWFSKTSSAIAVLVIGSVWSCFGTNVLYFSAALTNIPDELYEAAELDGATHIHKFTHITIPMIAPVFQTILLLAINGTLQTGEYVYVMTAGAPGGTTNTVGSYMMQMFLPGFSTGTPNIGYGCTLSLISSVIYASVALAYLKTSKKMNEVY